MKSKKNRWNELFRRNSQASAEFFFNNKIFADRVITFATNKRFILTYQQNV